MFCKFLPAWFIASIYCFQTCPVACIFYMAFPGYVPGEFVISKQENTAFWSGSLVKSLAVSVEPCYPGTNISQVWHNDFCKL